MRSQRFGIAAFGLGLLSLALGCGGDDPLNRQTVSGKVTIDGTPLQEGSISFQPTEQGSTSSGAVITQGAYSIPQDKGLPPGKYRVMINAVKPGTGSELPAGGMPGDETGAPAEELIPPSWNTESEQFIEVTESGPNEFTHEIVIAQ
jgi:hypothetical protein